MIKEQLENNENVKPNTKLLNLLKENFPDYFDKDNNFMIDKFKITLKSEEINITKEGYELNFLGKSYARFQTSTETETIISPLTDHNNKDKNKNSENLYIIGDNLDALKHLLKSYSRKVKCIYIDPPYNTGSDGFVYPDNFKFDSATLSNKMGIDEEEAERIIDMRGKSTHSAWLTFMYPRLILARDLLADDGAIIISIDDNEYSDLKLICDEIFGEENNIANIVWKRKRGRDNSAKWFSKSHEYAMLYSKNKESFYTNKLDLDENTLKEYKNPDNDSRGRYRKLGCWARGTQSGVKYSYTSLDGKFFSERLWLFSKENLSKLEKDNKLIFIGDKIYWKKFLSDHVGQIPETLWDNVSNSANASDEIKSLFNEIVFDTSKPTPYINQILKICSNQNSLVLDFFSGSATTAHAVMKLNAEDGGNRKYILVQLPEEIEESKPAFKAGYRTIDEIGRERIKRAAKKIKEETNADIDYGFKVVKLENVQENTLDRLESFDPNVLVSDDYVNDFSNEDSSGLETILTTWLNQDGYGLHAKWEEFKLVDYIAHHYSNSLYIVNEGIESSDISRLIEMIENNKLNISRIVIYTYSLPFTIINELKTNIKNLRNNKTVDIIERY